MHKTFQTSGMRFLIIMMATSHVSAQETVKKNGSSQLAKRVYAMTNRASYHNYDLEKKKLKRLTKNATDEFGDLRKNWQPINHVSLVRLLAEPEKHRRKPVNFSGYMLVERGNNVVFLSKEDAAHSFTKNAVWIDLGQETMKKAGVVPESFHCKYVTIEGIFNYREDDVPGTNSGVLVLEHVWGITEETERELKPVEPAELKKMLESKESGN